MVFTLLSINLCLIAPGGNLRFQGPLFMTGSITTLALVFGLSYFVFHLSIAWSIGLTVVLSPFLSANVALLWALLIALVAPSLHVQYKKERLEEFAAQIDGFDVICIQECINTWFSALYQEELLDLVREKGFLFYAETRKRPRFPAMLANSGLLIVSKIPIVSYHSHIYRRQAWYDIFAVNRAALHAELALDNNLHFHLFTTHLAPGTEALLALMNVDNKKWNLVQLENNDALTQSSELIDFIKEHAKGENSNVAVAGDLNFRGGSATYHGFVNHLANLGLNMQDVMAQRKPNGDISWPPTFGNVDENGDPAETLITRPCDRGHPKTLDYIFSNMPWSTEGEQSPKVVPFTVVGRKFKQVSDHQGVSATFTI